MACDRARRSGQALTELIVAMLALTLVVLALTEFVPVFMENLALQKEVREEAGLSAIRSEAAEVFADRRSEFALDIPGDWIDSDGTSGTFSEKQYMPAANLSCVEPVTIPPIGGIEEEIHYRNDAGTSEFMSAVAGGTAASVLAKVRVAFAGWTDCGINAPDALLFTGSSGKTVAAAHVMEETSPDGVASVRLTVIVRTAGGKIGF